MSAIQNASAFPGAHHAVVEATGRWYWLRDLLVPQGVDLHLAHAKFLKAIAYAKVKTDAVDSATLAQLLRTGLIPEAHMITDAQRGPPNVSAGSVVLRGGSVIVTSGTDQSVPRQTCAPRQQLQISAPSPAAFAG